MGITNLTFGKGGINDVKEVVALTPKPTKCYIDPALESKDPSFYLINNVLRRLYKYEAAPLYQWQDNLILNKGRGSRYPYNTPVPKYQVPKNNPYIKKEITPKQEKS